MTRRHPRAATFRTRDGRDPMPRTYVGDARDVPTSRCACCGGSTSEHNFFGPFRLHHSCHGLLGSNASRVRAAAAWLRLGEVSEAEAGLIACPVPRYADTDAADPTETRTRLPWSHVDARGLRRALKGLPAARRAAGLDPSRCSQGACAWCGRSTSLGWHSSPYRWPNGDPAPLCRDCHDVWVRRSEPEWPDDVAVALAEAITGVPWSLGQAPPRGLVPFCALNGPTGDHPWHYLPAEGVDRLRWECWARYGGAYAPTEHREEALARAAAVDASKAARKASQEAENAAMQDVFGFGEVVGRDEA
jgi:hypothetical protein